MKNKVTFWDGIHSAIPVSLGYISIGAAFGIVASAQGYSVWQVFFLSVFLYAGASQFIIVAMMAVNTPISIMVLTVFLVNFRMFLQSLATSQVFPKQSLISGLLMGSFITDESFGLLTLEQAKRSPITPMWMHGVNVMSYLTWVLSTVIFTALGSLIPNPEQYGIDYALVAMFIGLLALTIDSMVTYEKLSVVLIVMIASILIYFVVGVFTSSYLAVLIATVIGALVGAILTSPKQDKSMEVV